MLHARPDYERIQDPEGLIPVDEPVFLIRGQDVCGPATVRAWAEKAEQAGADAEIVGKAKRHARRMEEWQETQAKKVPDLPTT